MCSRQVLRVDKIFTIPRIEYLDTSSIDGVSGYESLHPRAKADLALIKLKGKVKNWHKKTVCLPDARERGWYNKNADVYGWGAADMEWEATVPGKYPAWKNFCLQEAKVKTMSRKTCEKIWGDGAMSKWTFCAGKELAPFRWENGRWELGKYVDTCEGDSGGPMTIAKNRNHVQIGITSSGVTKSLCGIDVSTCLNIFSTLSVLCC